jgi:hypothetical protein
MENNKSKQPVPRKFRLAIYRYRFRRDHPEEAKARAMKGTISTIKKWNAKNDLFVQLLKTQLPQQLTTFELRWYLNQIEYHNPKTGKNYNPLSLQRRLMRRGLIKYDAGLGKWINLTLLQLPESE